MNYYVGDLYNVEVGVYNRKCINANEDYYDTYVAYTTSSYDDAKAFVESYRFDDSQRHHADEFAGIRIVRV